MRSWQKIDCILHGITLINWHARLWGLPQNVFVITFIRTTISWKERTEKLNANMPVANVLTLAIYQSMDLRTSNAHASTPTKIIKLTKRTVKIVHAKGFNRRGTVPAI